MWVFGKSTSTLSEVRSKIYLSHRDSVSSAGLIPQTHPYTSINYSVKCFRHALALDERRIRFHPSAWGERRVECEQGLDVDLPVDWKIDRSNPDGWQYTAPKRNHADVKEVWFAGDLTYK